MRCKGSRRRRPDTGGWVRALGAAGLSVWGIWCEGYRGPLPDVLKPDFQCVRTALKPGFHGASAGPTQPDRGADGADVAWVRFSGRCRPAAGPGTGRGGADGNWRYRADWAGEGEGRVLGGRGREFGINGESSGKDGVNTNRRSSLVFFKLRRVTCGVAVHKAVDN